MSKADYYSEANHGPHQIFELGNYELESGITLPNAKIAYKTHGALNEARDNVVLFPHMWSGTPKAMEIFIGHDPRSTREDTSSSCRASSPMASRRRPAIRHRRSTTARFQMSPSAMTFVPSIGS